MIILDTDHIVTLKHENDPHWNTLTTNLVSSADQDFATTAITVEEQNRGWLALINRYTDVHKQQPCSARICGTSNKCPACASKIGLNEIPR